MTEANQTVEITLTMPKVLEVVSREQSVDVECEKLSGDILAKALTYGLVQKIADSGAGAAYQAALGAMTNEEAKDKTLVKAWTSDSANWMAIQAECKRLMQVCYDKLVAGDWGRVSNGGNAKVPPVLKLARELARKDVKAALAARDGNAKKFTQLVLGEQVKILDAMVNKEGAEYMALAEKELAATKEAVQGLDLGSMGI